MKITHINTLYNDLFDNDQFSGNVTLTTNFKDDFDSDMNEDSYKLELLVPGLTKDAISIKVIEGKLKIEGGIVGHKWTPEFKKSFILPTNTDIKNIKAIVENGILTVTVGIDKKSETIINIM